MKSIRVFVIGTLILGLVAGVIQANEAACASGFDYTAQGQAALDRGDATAALAAFACAIEIQADNFPAYLGHASAALALGDFQTAFLDMSFLDVRAAGFIRQSPDDLTARIEADPLDIRAYELRAALHWFKAQDDLALPDYAAILEIDPDNLFATLFQASSNTFLGNNAEAEAGFARARELSPDDPQVLAIMAETYAYGGEAATAVELASEAIALSPEFAPLYRIRGMAQQFSGDLDSALVDYNRAIELDPTFWNAYERRAWLYEQLGNIDQAIADFTSAIEVNPWAYLSYIGRAFHRSNMGLTDGVAEDLAMYAMLMPGEVIDGGALTSGTSLTTPMAFSRAYHYTFDAAAGQHLNITVASANSGEVDPLAVVLDSTGTALVANDDANDQKDAVIRDFEIETGGTYTLIVTHSNGPDTGDLTVTFAIEE